MNIDSRGWIGRDRDRLWFRAEGDGESGRVGEAQTHVLYGRQFSRWWDLVAGIRQDFRPGPAQTWAAFGVQGLAPYWFEIEATAYVGASGRTHARFEVEYELLLTNRLVLQPLLEAEIVGKSDPETRCGRRPEHHRHAGFRLRYEFRRELAPYVGVTLEQQMGEDRRLRRGRRRRTRAELDSSLGCGCGFKLGQLLGDTMMKRFSATVLALAVLALGSGARLLAHEGHEHKVMGTVTMAAADHVMLKDKDGKDVTVKVTKDTKVKAKPAIKVEDIKVGTRVVVTAVEEKDKSMTAKSIEVGAAPAATK